jgi:hypothetical protein
MSAIRRYSTYQLVALTDVAATTGEIDISQYASGQVTIPTGSGITGLTWYVASGKGGTYIPAQDASGSAITQTVAATKSYPIPSTLFGAPFIKAVANTTGNVDVNLKS